MNGSQQELLFKNEAYQVVGCAMEVLNTLGHGLLEKSYENALVVECGLRLVPIVQQQHFDVVYKGVRVGKYIPDLIAFGKIIIETKTIDQITDIDRGQLINYLRVTNLRLGLILNFKHPKLEWERIVL